MKKVMIASMFLLCFGMASLAQTTPQKKEPAKQEKKAADKQQHMAKHHSKKTPKKPAGA